ncbi:hypothetical protein ACP70R_014170 [Stipagrostis hirtigluma subsp. patula]
MAVAEELVLLSRDDKTVSLAVIPPAAAPREAAAAAAATFRLVVEQSYRRADAGVEASADEDVDTMEDVTCRVPVGELGDGEAAAAAAAAVDRAFDELVARLDHPTLRPEVAPEAREAAARVRARCAEEGTRLAALGGVEFRLRVVFVDTFDEEESDPEPDGEEETGSDLEFDEASWERGGSDDDSQWQYEHDHAVLTGDDDDASGGDSQWQYEHDEAVFTGDDDAAGDDGQFSARPFAGALAREGGPSDGTLLLSGFEARSDGPELGEQHELTPRDTQRLVRLALGGGDMEGDEAYQRALAGGAPVSRASRAAMLDQALRSAAPQQKPTPTSLPRMRTGW